MKISSSIQFIFKHFGKFWLAAFVIGILTSVGTLALLVWAVIKLVNHFTASPVTAAISNTLSHLS